MKRLLLIILALSLVLITACTTGNVVQEAETEVEEVTYKPVVFTEIEKTSDEYNEYVDCVADCNDCENKCEDQYDADKAVETEDIVHCEDIESDVVKDNCFNNVKYVKAIASKDPEFCKSISDQYRRTECLNFLQTGELMTE